MVDNLTVYNAPQCITVSMGATGVFVSIHPDGTVTWEGELTDSAKKFWEAVMLAFPVFADEFKQRMIVDIQKAGW